LNFGDFPQIKNFNIAEIHKNTWFQFPEFEMMPEYLLNSSFNME